MGPSKRPGEAADGDGVRDAWEMGLRRRRGRNSSRSEGNNSAATPPRETNGSSQGHSAPNGSSRPLHGAPGPAASNGNLSTGMGAAAGPCGGGAGGVGVLASPAGAPLGGGAPSTPFKSPPTKETGLVAATPSSITTAGTAASTVLTQPSPLRVRRRRGGRPPLRSEPSLQRQYQLLRSQILLLLGTAALGLVLFLFYALPLAAFVSFALMMSSMGALIPVARSIVRARYEMEMEQPGGLTRYLPEYLRVLLTETSMHEFMTDTTFFMENRYLLLYFMPGLEPEQLMNFIERLPPRHREALMQPGLGRMFPSLMENLMRLSPNADALQPLIEEMREDDASTASGLTNNLEHQGDGEGDAEVTLLDAVTGLRRTLAAGYGSAGGDAAPLALEGAPAVAPIAMMQPLPQIADAPATNEANDEQSEEEEEVVDDNSSFDFSIDARSLQGMLGDEEEEPATPEAPAQNVIVELPPSPEPEPDQTDEPNDEAQQQEYDLEGQILTEAATAAATNYAAQAAGVARDGAAEVVASSSSWVVRAGALTGVVAGGGGIAAAMVANHQGPAPRLLITLGAMTGATGVDGPGGGNGGNGAGPERQLANAAAQWIHGLFAASAFGFASAGAAYILRNRMRATIAADREKRLQDQDASEKKDGQDGDTDKP